MNARHLLFPLLFGGFLSANTFIHAQAVHPQQTAPQRLLFVENKGQVTDQYSQPRTDVHFRSGSNGLSLFVGSGKLHYQWAADAGKERTALCRMDVTLIGADPQAKSAAEQKQGYYERYYTAAAGQQGIAAHAFLKITYSNVYPNIDWVLYVKDNTVEYDFVVHPGGKVSDIKLQYGGAASLVVDKAGKLTATTPMGSITEAAPVSYQADGKAVASSFVLRGNTLGFATGDYSGTLIIDPTLSWATYYGGTMDEDSRNNNVTGDRQGNVYLGGVTHSTANIATTGSYQDTLTLGTQDAFLVKFDATGVRQWATYYGGSGTEYVYGIACDTAGKVYIAGSTNSATGFASTGAYQTTIGTTGSGTDAFLLKMDTSGTRLWATYYGGSSGEKGLGVTCDLMGNVYLTGFSTSLANIATTGAYQTAKAGGQDAFLAKFNNAGTLQWATYYGGTGTDNGLAIACDTAMNVYLTGYTNSSTGIATTGAYQTLAGGGQDVFIAKFDSAGAQQWATYYGGSGDDQGVSMTCDPAAGVYVCGTTYSSSGISTTGSHQPTYGGDADAYLAKFSSGGARLWATYYGSPDVETGYSISSSASGYIYLSGYAGSYSGGDTAIATTGTFQDTLNSTIDAYLVKFDTAGVRQWGTYFGGEADDYGYSVYCNGQSKVFLAGITSSYTHIATTGSHQSSNGGGTSDAFLAQFDDCILTAATAITGSDSVCRNASYTYSVPAVPGATSYTWSVPAGWSGSSTTNTITLTTGTNSDTLRVSANFLCGTSAETIKAIAVSPLPTVSPTGTVNICAGDSVTLSASTGTAYRWYRNDTAIAGATNALYTAHVAGHYTVIATSPQGCADTSLIDTLVFHPLPVPVITASGTVLSTGTYSSYQWNHNGTPITGATGSSYTILITSGNYTVTVTDANGCEGTSAPFDGGTVGIDDLSGNNHVVRIYPNPASDRIYIDAKGKVNVTISSMEGKIQGSYTHAKDIDLSTYASGIYLLRLTDQSGALLHTEKLVISRNP